MAWINSESTHATNIGVPFSFLKLNQAGAQRNPTNICSRKIPDFPGSHSKSAFEWDEIVILRRVLIENTTVLPSSRLLGSLPVKDLFEFIFVDTGCSNRIRSSIVLRIGQPRFGLLGSVRQGGRGTAARLTKESLFGPELPAGLVCSTDRGP